MQNSNILKKWKVILTILVIVAGGIFLVQKIQADTVNADQITAPDSEVGYIEGSQINPLISPEVITNPTESTVSKPKSNLTTKPTTHTNTTTTVKNPTQPTITAPIVEEPVTTTPPDTTPPDEVLDEMPPPPPVD